MFTLFSQKSRLEVKLAAAEAELDVRYRYVQGEHDGWERMKYTSTAIKVAKLKKKLEILNRYAEQ